MYKRQAGYLLNPLGDTYAYDDLARDYLGLTIPSQADLLGKEKLPASLAAGVEKAFDCACFMGYVAYKAAGPLTEKLRETGMHSLFTDIEMPLIYSLFHMEEEGIRVETVSYTHLPQRPQRGIRAEAHPHIPAGYLRH